MPGIDLVAGFVNSETEVAYLRSTYNIGPYNLIVLIPSCCKNSLPHQNSIFLPN